MGKIGLTKEKRVIVIGAVIALVALVVYLIFYVPLMNGLRTGYLECKSIENDVFDVRNIIESAKGARRKRVLIAEEDVSRAIGEITNHGRLNGVNFISINPKKAVKEEDSGYKILPVEMEIESTYEQLGIFLGSLDDLEKALVMVKSFKITSHKEGSSKLTADLVIYIHLLGKESFWGIN